MRINWRIYSLLKPKTSGVKPWARLWWAGERETGTMKTIFNSKKNWFGKRWDHVSSKQRYRLNYLKLFRAWKSRTSHDNNNAAQAVSGSYHDTHANSQELPSIVTVVRLCTSFRGFSTISSRFSDRVAVLYQDLVASQQRPSQVPPPSKR